MPNRQHHGWIYRLDFGIGYFSKWWHFCQLQLPRDSSGGIWLRQILFLLRRNQAFGLHKTLSYNISFQGTWIHLVAYLAVRVPDTEVLPLGSCNLVVFACTLFSDVVTYGHCTIIRTGRRQYPCFTFAAGLGLAYWQSTMKVSYRLS